MLLENAGLDGVGGDVPRSRPTLLLGAGDERVVHRLRDGLAPAGEGLGTVPHVVLAECAGAHREELHELAAVVLVRTLAGGRSEVEIAKHPRIDRDLIEHVVKVAERHLPPGQVLPVDVGRLQVDLAEVAGEMAVPEEGHALRERGRRAQHPIEPPADELLRLDRLLLRRVIRAGEGRGLGCFRFDETVDGLLEPVLY